MGKLKGGYKKIEKGTIDGYKKIEETVVGGYKKIEDKFVDKFLRNDDETIEEAKERIKKEQEELNTNLNHEVFGEYIYFFHSVSCFLCGFQVY